MRKNRWIIFAILLGIIILMSFASSNSAKYYYAYNERIYLSELPNKLLLRFSSNMQSHFAYSSNTEVLKKNSIEWIDDSTLIVQLKDVSEANEIKMSLSRDKDVISCQNLLTTSGNDILGLTDEIIVKFKENVPQQEIENLNRKFKTKTIETNEIFQLLKVPNNMDVLSVANYYQESGLTLFSHPNFISKIVFSSVIPNDTYFVNQFYLHNTGQVFCDGHFGTLGADISAPEAWRVTKGNANIVVAVIDDGVTSDHPDLPNSRQLRLNNSNTAPDGDPNNPSPTGNDNHGNSCAGIISATQNNSQGISGIAPLCKIMPVRPTNSGGSITPSKLANSITFARQNGAHVISISWALQSDNPNFWPVVREAIIYVFRPIFTI